MTSSLISRTALRASRFRSHINRTNVVSPSFLINQSGTRRLASSEATAKSSGTWRGALVRWGLAAGVVYYYNTSPIFANESSFLPAGPPAVEPLPTLDSIAAARSKKKTSEGVITKASSDKGEEQIDAKSKTSGVAELETEAESEGAFNPETGEINWDCPCLGGMAHGPCGEEFKAAFSCFVYSKEEPKGMECIDKFKAMQDCFRDHPDVYAEELAEDDDEAELQTGDKPLTGGIPGDQPQSEEPGTKDSVIVSKPEETNNTISEK